MGDGRDNSVCAGREGGGGEGAHLWRVVERSVNLPIDKGQQVGLSLWAVGV